MLATCSSERDRRSESVRVIHTMTTVSIHHTKPHTHERMYIHTHIHTYLADLGEEALEVQDNGQGLGRVPLVQGLVRHVLLRLRQVLHAGLHLLGWWGVRGL